MSKNKNPVHWFEKKVLGITSSKKTVVTSSEMTTESNLGEEKDSSQSYSLEYKFPYIPKGNNPDSSSYVTSYSNIKTSMNRWDFVHLVDKDLLELLKLEAAEVETSISYEAQVYAAVKWTLVGAYIVSKTLWFYGLDIDTNRVLSKFRNLEPDSFIHTGIIFSLHASDYISGHRTFYRIAPDHDQMIKKVEIIARAISEKFKSNADADSLLMKRDEEYIKITAAITQTVSEVEVRDQKYTQEWLEKDLEKCFSLPESEGLRTGLLLAKMLLMPILFGRLDIRDLFKSIEAEIDKLVAPVEEQILSNAEEGKIVTSEGIEVELVSEVVPISEVTSHTNDITRLLVLTDAKNLLAVTQIPAVNGTTAETSYVTGLSSTIPLGQSLNDFIVSYKPDYDGDGAGIKIVTSSNEKQDTNIEWIAEIDNRGVKAYLLSLEIYQRFEVLIAKISERIRHVSKKINFQLEFHEVNGDSFKGDTINVDDKYNAVDLVSHDFSAASVEMNSGVLGLGALGGVLGVGF